MSDSRGGDNSFISNENDDYDDYNDAQKDPALPSTLLIFFKGAAAPDKEKSTYSNEGLRRECEQSSHVLSISIVDLLNADDEFLFATNPDFKEKHAKTADKDILKRLNMFADAIEKMVAINNQAQIGSETITDYHHKTLDAVISYIVQSTKDRLDELRNAHDKYFTLYQSNEKNKLRPLMQELTSKMTAPKV